MPIAPKTPLEQAVEAAVTRALGTALKPLVDRLTKLEKVDEGVNEALGQVKDRLTAKSGAYKDLLGTVQKQSDSIVGVDERQDTVEDRVERIDDRVARIETKMDTQLRQAGVAQGALQTTASNTAAVSFDTAQIRSKQDDQMSAARLRFWATILPVIATALATLYTAIFR